MTHQTQESHRAAMPARWLVWIMITILSAVSVRAQDIVAPVIPAPEVQELSGARKGVKVSTDVLLCAMPVAALTGVLVARDWQGLRQGVLTAVASFGTTTLLKWVVNERRPDGSDYHSFPSGHSSTTFATAAFLQRRYGWKFGAPAYVLATYTAWGRVFARKHHWWDVVAGAAIGAGSAYIFTRPWAREHNLSLAPATDGRNFALIASFTL